MSLYRWGLSVVLMSLLAGCAGMAAEVPAPAPSEPLVGTYWKLTSLDGEPVTVLDQRREAHLVLAADGRVHGSTGCNRFAGRYRREGARVSFSSLAATRMACPDDAMRQERAWLEALEQTQSVSQQGQRLRLEDANRQPLAELVANALY
ncbi:META domain-containing protein [Salinicola avicenniae]|uniref:META domain-containing protein n=1 Tax=Salinicola avicenniae TaxID=2916836 RepID=UPI002072EB91|nr:MULTISPECIES: META domain-containing protein [unclassified Salinicola]